MFIKNKLLKITRFRIYPLLIILFIIQPLFSQQSNLDLSFGINGVFSTVIGTRSSIHSFVLQPDGNIIVVGSATIANKNYFLLLRISTEGTLDTTFGTNGIVTTDFLYGGSINDVSFQKDGKIVVVGTVINSSLYQEIGIARYNIDGSLDLTFSTDGKVNSYYYSFKDRVDGIGVHILDNGKIIAAGNFGGDGVLFRYNQNGTIDNSFSMDGKTQIINYPTDKIYCSAIQPDGKILVAGTQFPSNGSDSDFYIARVKEDGTKDSSFANKGVFVLDLNDKSDYGHSLLTLADGSILIGGESNGKFTVIKLNSHGVIDTNYGVNGILNTPLWSCCYHSVPKKSMALLSGDSTMIGGYSGPFSLMRLTPNGVIDINFGSNGFMKSNVNGNAGKIIIQSDGKIIQIGNSTDGSGKIFVLRYFPSLTVNTFEDYTLSGVKLFPNPTKDHLQLHYFLSQDERVTMQLYNLHGKLVSEFLDFSLRYSGENKEIINLSELQNGVYTLLINYSTKVYTTKIIKI